jgi:hypothetical protein
MYSKQSCGCTSDICGLYILILAEKETHIDQVIAMLKAKFSDVKSEKRKIYPVLE